MSFSTIFVQDEALSNGRGSAPGARRHNPKPAIKCSQCSKTFKRSEHRARHELSHTNERPFACRFCNKCYARKDLVKRHERIIHADLHNKVVKQSTESSFGQKKSASGACTFSSDGSHSSSTLASHPEDDSGSRMAALSDRDQGLRACKELTPVPTTATTFAHSDDASSKITAQAPSATADATKMLINASVAGGRPTVPPSSKMRVLPTVAGPNVLDLSPIPNLGTFADQLDFNFSSLLATSNLNEGMRCDDHLDREDMEQPQNKRQRLNSSGPWNNELQSENRNPKISQTTVQTNSFGSMFESSSLMDIDVMMGSVSNEFFFHQIGQQNDQLLDSSSSIRNFPGVSNDFGFTLTDPNGYSKTEHTADTPSDGETERTDRVRLPMILKERSEHPPRLVVDDFAFLALSTDVIERIGDEEVILPVKHRRELQHFLAGYLDCFHRHLPILHLPTLKVSQTPSPLILAMCCIGALYRLERRKAKDLFDFVARMSEADSKRNSYPSPSLSTSSESLESREVGQIAGLQPLWLMQTHLLMLLYGVLGDDSAIAQSELARMGVFMTDYRARRSGIAARSSQNVTLQWQEWIDIEATKRFLCATFICSSLLVLVYDLPPGFGVTQDLELEVLEEERLWTASAEQWQALRNQKMPTRARTIRNVMSDMLAGKTNDQHDSQLYQISGFTTLAVIHGLNMYAWSLRQLSHVFTSPHANFSDATSNMFLEHALTTLGRCHEVLRIARSDRDESLWNNPEGPLLLNCEAMLRVAYARLFTSIHMPEGMNLLLISSTDTTVMLYDFANANQERTPLVTRAMACMCEAFAVPSKAGYLLVQKTAAISWSVEHALAGWSCVLLLSKWLHRLDVQTDDLPLTVAELEVVSLVKTALDGMGMVPEGQESLAAAVVASWAPLMTDVWVWGITTKMGSILSKLANVYENASKTAKGHRLKT